jgi:sulfur carrier protein
MNCFFKAYPEKVKPFLFENEGIRMKITVNGKIEIVDEKTTINDFLVQKNLEPEKVVVEHNTDIMDRKNLDNVILNENDTLEILRFVGGG